MTSTVAAPREPWIGRGRSGGTLDLVVGVLMLSGAQAEAVEPGRVYRLQVPRGLDLFIAGLVVAGRITDPSLGVDRERTPRATAVTLHRCGDAPRRKVLLRGQEAAVPALRAVDMGLQASHLGEGRWEVSGPGVALHDWLVMHGGYSAERLREQGWHRELLLREDDTSAAPVDDRPQRVEVVAMPARTSTTTTDILRDAEGEIVKVSQIQAERDAGPAGAGAV